MFITILVLGTFLAAALYTRHVIDQDGYGSRPPTHEPSPADRDTRPTSLLREAGAAQNRPRTTNP